MFSRDRPHGVHDGFCMGESSMREKGAGVKGGALQARWPCKFR